MTKSQTEIKIEIFKKQNKLTIMHNKKIQSNEIK